MSNEKKSGGASAETRKDWGENGITPERVTWAKAMLLANAEEHEQKAARYITEKALDVLKAADGKTITRRLFDKLAAAWGVEKAANMWGGFHYPGLRWSDEKSYFGRKYKIEIESTSGYLYRLELIHDGGTLDAGRTVAKWTEEAERWRKWARENRACADCIEFAAAEYNAIHAHARKLMEALHGRLDGEGIINPEISVLCAFKGDIYDRLNPFRWYESKCWQDERRG